MNPLTGSIGHPIHPIQGHKKLLKEGVILLDVRSLAEFAEGHAKTAILLPIEDLSFFKDVIKSWKRPVLTCSSTGKRSKKAMHALRKEGVPAFDGGAWEAWK